jgi:hypothetical protein
VAVEVGVGDWTVTWEARRAEQPSPMKRRKRTGRIRSEESLRVLFMAGIVANKVRGGRGLVLKGATK